MIWQLSRYGGRAYIFTSWIEFIYLFIWIYPQEVLYLVVGEKLMLNIGDVFQLWEVMVEMF